MTWTRCSLALHLCLAWMAITYNCAAASRDRNDKVFRAVCVHVANSFYRLGNGKFTVEDIDPNLCTHLIYDHVGIRDNHIQSIDGYLDLETDFGRGNFRKFNDLKEKNPKLTTLLSVGGKTEGSIKFSELAKDPAKRATFVQSVLKILVQYDFDGLNLDWQYPSQRGGVPEDKQSFTTLLQDLRTAFDQNGFVLTATVASQKDTIDQAYEVDKIFKIVDFVNVLTYDYKVSSSKLTGLSAPLFSGSSSPQDSVDLTIKDWLKKGADASKLVVGMSFYGQSWTLASGGGVQGPGSKATGPGETWPYTREAGKIAYNEFCESQKEKDWKVTWQEPEKANFAYQGDQWISFDSVRSVAEKSTYVVLNALGGVLLHGIESDDGKGICSSDKFPLLTAAFKVLNGQIEPSTQPPVETTTSPPPPDSFQCKDTGFFRNPKDCTRYFQCIKSGWTGHFIAIVHSCGVGTVFDEKHTVCDWPHKVPGC